MVFFRNRRDLIAAFLKRDFSGDLYGEFPLVGCGDRSDKVGTLVCRPSIELETIGSIRERISSLASTVKVDSLWISESSSFGSQAKPKKRNSRKKNALLRKTMGGSVK